MDNISQTPEIDRENAPDLVCALCSVNNKWSTARWFCINCIKYLCKECYNNQKMFKVLRNHTILNEDEMPKDTSVFKKMASLSFCKKHSDREIEYKCLKHNEFVCSSCVTLAHRNCPDLEYASDIKCDKESMRQLYLDITAQLQRSVDDEVSVKLKHAENVEIEALEEERQHCDFVHQMKSLVVSLEQLPPVGLVEHIRHEATQLNKCFTDCERINKSIYENIRFTETVLKYGTNTQIIMLEKELKEDADEISSKLQVSQNSDKMLSPKYASDDEYNTLMKMKELIQHRMERYRRSQSDAKDLIENALPE